MPAYLARSFIPQNFNTLRRIKEEDGKVVEEQGQFVELVSSNWLLQNLRNLLNGGDAPVEALPDGIHSGLVRQGARGVFFYFTAQRNVRGIPRGCPGRRGYPILAPTLLALYRPVTRQEGWAYRR